MRLDHLDLCATDVEGLQATLEQHFGYSTVDAGTVPDVPGLAGAGTVYAMLIGSDGSNLVLSRSSRAIARRSPTRSVPGPRAVRH